MYVSSSTFIISSTGAFRSSSTTSSSLVCSSCPLCSGLGSSSTARVAAPGDHNHHCQFLCWFLSLLWFLFLLYSSYTDQPVAIESGGCRFFGTIISSSSRGSPCSSILKSNIKSKLCEGPISLVWTLTMWTQSTDLGVMPTKSFTGCAKGHRKQININHKETKLVQTLQA